MALGFALCATMVFAQIPAKKETRASLSGKSFEAVAMPTEDVQEQATFKGSIFSKNVVVKEVETFGAPATESTYTVGTATIPYTHTQAAGHSRWFRVADTTTGAITAAGDIAPVLVGEEGWYSSMYGFNSGSPMDGFMACSMLDQVGGDWGGTGLPGNFNTYIEFPAFTTIPAEGETIAILDAKLYQYYRCFNNDKCNIDYSTDGGVTWDSVEFNIARIDVAVNSAALGWKSVTLPQSLLNQESVKIRVRYSSNNAGGSPGEALLLPKMPLTLINPEIVFSSSECDEKDEGCLSVPGLYAPVCRPSRVVLRSQILDGDFIEIECGGLLGRCIQHELDHLDGKLFTDRLSPQVSRAVRGDVDRLKRIGQSQNFRRKN